ncbi:MAG: YqaA family protein [Rhizomicrobium sp.]|jgi:membrane protein YqaA with SNARE-associated domain
MADGVDSQPRANALRRLYNWTISKASGPHAWWALAAFSFAEASFFPIPPDVMLAPMVLAERRRAFQLAGWCTLFSVLGGLFGYAIGSLLYDSIGHWLIRLYGYSDKIQAFSAAYQRNAWLILFQGFTPIPFKLVTISAGFARLYLPKFILFCTITRGARFMLEATFLYWLGEPVREFIEKWLEVVSVVFLLLVVAGFLIARYAF